MATKLARHGRSNVRITELSSYNIATFYRLSPLASKSLNRRGLEKSQGASIRKEHRPRSALLLSFPPPHRRSPRPLYIYQPWAR